MTNEENYVIEKFKEFKLKKRKEMIKALVAAGYSCNEIAVVLNFTESSVRAWADLDNENSQNETK